MLYLIFIVVLLAVVFGPSLWVRWVMRAYGPEIPGMPGTGGELAEHLIDKLGLDGVGVEQTELGDHYDPRDRKVRLSPDHYDKKSLAAVVVAAHEVGHAMQHHDGDRNLLRRTTMVPVADRVARMSVGMLGLAPIAGLLLRHPVPFSLLATIGIVGLIARMLVHLVTLPTEWDASFNKAMPVLEAGRYIAPAEHEPARRILRAAALTYFAAALADVLNLARWAAILVRR